LVRSYDIVCAVDTTAHERKKESIENFLILIYRSSRNTRQQTILTKRQKAFEHSGPLSTGEGGGRGLSLS
jgi:hypothetical protein